MLEGKEVVMGMFRRLTYVGTHGIVDFRSDSERIARYSKKLINEHKPTLRHTARMRSR
jgi:hypothetical protein